VTRRSALDPAAAALLVGLCAIWGGGQVAIKVGNQGVSPLWHAAIRSGVATLLLWAWCRARGIPLVARDGSGRYGALIALLFALEFVCVYWGLVFTTAARAVLFIYAAPFVVAVGAHWLLPGERLQGVKVVGLVAAFGGLVLAFADGLRLPTWRELGGDGLELVGAVLWALTTLVIKAWGSTVSPHRTLFYQLAGSALVLAVLAAATGEAGVTRLSGPVLLAVGYQAVVIAFASYLLWFWLLARYPASHMHAFTFWTPLFGLLGGWLLLGEPVTAALVLAMALVAAGTYLVNRASPRGALRSTPASPAAGTPAAISRATGARGAPGAAGGPDRAARPGPGSS
jgi:drug/metabolite transporter (DMT)-like permease